MTAKLWGGVLLSVFVAAVGAEIIKRRYPGFTKKVSERTKTMTHSAGEKFNEFAASARDAFRNGYASVNTEAGKT